MCFVLVKQLVKILNQVRCDSFLDLNELFSECLDFKLAIMHLSLPLLQLLLCDSLSSLETGYFELKVPPLFFKLLKLSTLSLNTPGQGIN